MRCAMTLMFAVLVSGISVGCCKWCPAKTAIRSITVDHYGQCLAEPPPAQLPFDTEVIGPPGCPTDLVCLTQAGETAVIINIKKLRDYAAHAWTLCGPVITDVKAEPQ